MASNIGSPKAPAQATPTKSPVHNQETNFDHLEKTSNTLKRNPKMELNKSDLLKLLSYLEGELQARDIVIATLKCERVKQLLNQGRYYPLLLNDPHLALQRDSIASSEPRVDEVEIRALANQQMASLENLVLQYRRGQMHLGKILKDAEDRHKTELEAEKEKSKELEEEVKKMKEILDEERKRQKQIVLLLLAERKKIIMKYIEERKRSEDLAQILSEEKTRVDTMAEGLEEESKKSLQMEAELEKQFVQFDIERQQLRGALLKEEDRYKSLESELEKVRIEADSLKKQLAEAHQVAMFQASTVGVSPSRVIMPRSGVTAIPPQPPVKPAIIPGQGSIRPSVQQTGGMQLASSKTSAWGQTTLPRPDENISPPPPAGTPMMSSVAKVVQPTATVSSVPVCGPTTGIARSVSPGQGLRNMVYSPTTAPSSWPSPGQSNTALTDLSSAPQVGDKRNQQQTSQTVPGIPRMNLSASSTSKVATSQQGNKVPSQMSTEGNAELLKKPIPPGRGVPPPIPPNKPVVPPKKETVTSRRSEASVSSDAAKNTPGTKLGVTLLKGPSQGGDPQVGEEIPIPTPASLHDAPAPITASGKGLDILGQELADFQLQFVSMAAGSSIVAASTDDTFSAPPCNNTDDFFLPSTSTIIPVAKHTVTCYEEHCDESNDCTATQKRYIL